MPATPACNRLACKMKERLLPGCRVLSSAAREVSRSAGDAKDGTALNRDGSKLFIAGHSRCPLFQTAQQYVKRLKSAQEGRQCCVHIFDTQEDFQRFCTDWCATAAAKGYKRDPMAMSSWAPANHRSSEPLVWVTTPIIAATSDKADDAPAAENEDEAMDATYFLETVYVGGCQDLARLTESLCGAANPAADGSAKTTRRVRAVLALVLVALGIALVHTGLCIRTTWLWGG